VLNCCWDKLCRFQNLEQSVKTTLSRFEVEFLPPVKNATLFLRLPNIEDFRYKEIRQPDANGAQTFRRLARVKCHVPNRSETSG